MAIPRTHYATNISDRLIELAGKVKARSRAGLTDANRVAEPIICRLFNSLFGWELINLNREQANYPAADLGDRLRRIAVQVTNEDGADKITRTALKAREHGLKSEYDRLIIFFLLDRKPGFPKHFEQSDNAPKIEVWDIKDILDHAHECSDPEMARRASDVLDEELQPVGLVSKAAYQQLAGGAKIGHQFDHGTYGLTSSAEPVYTSFFEVTFPEHIRRAEIKLKRGVKLGEKLRSLWSGLKTKDAPPVDNFIEQGVVHTFDDLNLPIWQVLIAEKAIRALDPIKSSTWAQSSRLSDRNLFTKLLKRNLEQLCNHIGTEFRLGYSKELDCYLFQAAPNKPSGKIKVPALSKSGTREVFKAIPNTLPGREGETQHWKHPAFRHRFWTFGGKWFINIEPFWAFTGDGISSESRWHKTSSRNMKKPERNRAVVGHIMFWAALLCKEPDIFQTSSASIGIHRPSRLNVSPSIRDEDWKTIAPAEEKAILAADGQQELFMP